MYLLNEFQNREDLNPNYLERIDISLMIDFNNRIEKFQTKVDDLSLMI